MVKLSASFVWNWELKSNLYFAVWLGPINFDLSIRLAIDNLYLNWLKIQ